jgi:hypothetical protein
MRVALALAAGGALLLGAASLWLLRDPGPRFAARRSALATVEAAPPVRSSGMVSQTVRLSATSGLTLTVLVRTPEAPAAGGFPPAADGSGRRPLFLILGGYRTGERAAELVQETRGAVVAAMGYPYAGPLDVRGLGIVPHLPEIRRAILDTPPALQVALDYLLSLPNVDPDRVELVGVSFGAFLAPVAAALDTRVTRLWLVHGAGNPRKVLEHGLRNSVPHTVPRVLLAAAAHVVFAGPRLAPERWLPAVAPRPVVIINTADDERLPREAVAALYASALEPREQIWLSGPHVHPNREDVVSELMGVVLSRAAGVGPEGP